VTVFPLTTAIQRTTTFGCASSTAQQRINYYLTTAKRQGAGNYPEESLIDFFNKHKDSNDVYVRFTDIPKLGVFPKSEFNTPIGVCGYQCKSSVDKYGLINNKNPKTLGDYVKFPFASDKPYVWFYTFNPKSRLIDSDIYSVSDLNTDLVKLVQVVKAKVPNFFETFVETTLGHNFVYDSDYNYKDTLHDLGIPYKKFKAFELVTLAHIIDEARRSKVSTSSPFGILWVITRGISLHLATASQKFPSVWTSLFRSLNIGAARDNGLGVIHENEPVQTIIFNTADAKPLKLFENKIGPSSPTDLWKTDLPKAMKLWSIGKLPFPDGPTDLRLTFDDKLGTRGTLPEVLTARSVKFDNYKGSWPKTVHAYMVDFRNLGLTTIPVNVEADIINIWDCPKLTQLPNIVYPELTELNLRSIPISKLPESIQEIGVLTLYKTNVTELSESINYKDTVVITPLCDVRDLKISETVAPKVTINYSRDRAYPYSEIMDALAKYPPKYKLGDIVKLKYTGSNKLVHAKIVEIIPLSSSNEGCTEYQLVRLSDNINLSTMDGPRHVSPYIVGLVSPGKSGKPRSQYNKTVQAAVQRTKKLVSPIPLSYSDSTKIFPTEEAAKKVAAEFQSSDDDWTYKVIKNNYG